MSRVQAQISTKSGAGRAACMGRNLPIGDHWPSTPWHTLIWQLPVKPQGTGEKMHSLLELKLSLGSPSLVLATLWAVFFTCYRRESTRPSAWLALLLTSLSGIAALCAVVFLSDLMKRSITDVNYEAIGLILAISGFIAALVWFVRSRNLCAVGTIITASWLCYIWYLQFP